MTPRKAPRESRASFIMLWTVAAVAVAAAFIVHLSMRFETIERGYEVGAARREQRRLIEECRQLRLEAATYRRFERVESIARGTLRMQVPSADRIVPVDLADEGREMA
ncbi:MAG: cell division protein FtsL, partial [Myxococcota bacterium]